MRTRTRWLAALLAITFLTAGCLSTGPGTPAPDAGETTPTPSAATSTPSTATPTEGPSPPSWQEAANEPDANKSVWIANRWNETVTVDVRVVRNATAETVHDASYELPPETERDVYHTAAANPTGIERFTVVVSARNTTEHVSIETNECYGNAGATISDEGDLGVVYAIC